jgi:hypothetical protein
MCRDFQDLFPRLQGVAYQVTSPEDNRYNCIAWAAGDNERWWEPATLRYWPPTVPREDTLKAYLQAFATLGYECCAGEELESGFEKVALFMDDTGSPSHAARQLPNGRWTSKIGQREDIEHSLHDLAGETYGIVVQILKRPHPSAESPSGSATDSVS